MTYMKNVNYQFLKGDQDDGNVRDFGKTIQ